MKFSSTLLITLTITTLVMKATLAKDTGNCDICSVCDSTALDGKFCKGNCYKKQLTYADEAVLTDRACKGSPLEGCVYTTNNVTTECASCDKTKYYLKDKTCLKATAVANCVSYANTSGDCSGCKENFFLDDKACKAITKVNDCLTYFGSSGDCSSCKTEFYLDSKVCKAVTKVDKCKTYSGFSDTCYTCEDKHFIDDKKCTAITTTIDKCTKYLAADKCSTCEKFYQRNDDRTKCEKLSISKCISSSDLAKCTGSCDEKYRPNFAKTACIKEISGCTGYDKNDYCNSCGTFPDYFSGDITKNILDGTPDNSTPKYEQKCFKFASLTSIIAIAMAAFINF